MAGTYWLTILPETSRLVAGIRAAVRSVDDGLTVTIKPEVDDREAQRGGREYGSRYSRGFSETARPTVRPRVDERLGENDGRRYGERFAGGFSRAASGIGAGLRGIAVGFNVISASATQVIRHVGTAATVLGVSTRLIRVFSAATLASAIGLQGLVKGFGLAQLAGGLKVLASTASRVATEVSRITSALIVMRAVVATMGMMSRISKILALVTVGGAALLGVVTALSSVIWNSLIGALTIAGAAMGVAAGAAIGLLGPALGVAKIGFAGLSDAAKEFNKQFGDADETFNKMIGARMGPMLTAFRSLKQSITDTFSSTMAPAFATIGTVFDGLKPKLVGITTTMGLLGNELAGAFASPSVTASMTTMTDASNRFFQSFLGESGLTGITTGFAAFVATAADTFARVGEPINEFLLKAGDWLRNITPMQMELTFAALREAITSVGNVVRPVFSLLKQVGEVSAPALAPGMRSIGQAIKDMTPGLVQMTGILMPALSQVMTNLAPILPILVGSFMPWAQILAILAPTIATVVTALAPFAPLIMGLVFAVKAISAGIVVYNAVMFAYSVAQGVFAVATGVGTAALAGNATALAAYKVAAVAATIASRLLGIAITLATGPIGLIIAAVVAIGVGLWAFFTKTEAGRRIWTAAWNGIKTAASAVWEWLKSAIKVVGEVITNLWTGVVQPAFAAIGSIISQWWVGVQVVWDLFKAALTIAGDAIMSLWNNVAVPAFTAIGAVVSTMWDGIKIVWDGFTTALKFVGDKVVAFKDGLVNAFNAVKDVVLEVWDKIGGIIDKIGSGVGAVGDFLKTAGSEVLSVFGLGGGDAAGAATGGLIASRYAGGGRISGPGTAKSDSILGLPAMVRVSNGEYIVNAESTSRYLPLLQAINSGARFAEGGLVSADALTDFARGVDGKPYVRGGVNWGDCSGAVSAVANYATGRDPFGSRFATASAASELKSRGFKPGLGGSGSLSVGWYNGGPAGGHMAATLPDGTNFEMGGAAGNGQFGGAAAGAGDSMFSQRMHLPPEWFTGLDGGASTVGSSSSSSGGMSYRSATESELSTSSGKVASANSAVTQAQQAVDDKTYSRDRKKQRLDELAAAGKDTTDAQHSLDVANRELSDANQRLADKRDKAAKVESEDNELRTKGKLEKSKSKGSGSGSDMDGADFGQMFVSGLLESIGLDGSLFSNPLEWPTVKSAMAGVNFLGGLASGGEGGGGSVGGFASGAADAVGLGGMLSAIPGADSVLAAQSGSPALAPGEFNPAVAGGSIAPGGIGMSTFAPHGQGAGGAPGPAVDNSINFNGNVGMAPADVENKVTSMQGARTRTTKVNG